MPAASLATLKEEIFGRRAAGCLQRLSPITADIPLSFYCGELIDATIDPSSGALTHIPGCQQTMPVHRDKKIW